MVVERHFQPKTILPADDKNAKHLEGGEGGSSEAEPTSAMMIKRNLSEGTSPTSLTPLSESEPDNLDLCGSSRYRCS